MEELKTLNANENTTADIADDPVPFICSQRWILAYMGLFYGVMLYVFRVNLSIAIVCMVKSQSRTPEPANYTYGVTDTHVVTSSPEEDVERTGEHCEQLYSNSSLSDENAEFDWDKPTQAMLLSSYYYGTMVLQIVGGGLSGRFGGKHVVSVCMSISAVATLLLPVLARVSLYLVMVIRIILGLCSGAAMPAWFALVGVWALPFERSRMVAIFWIGQLLGTIIGYTTSGLLCTNGFDGGWPSIFYVHGICGLVFVGCWLYGTSNSPQSHPRISAGERRLYMDKPAYKTPKGERRNIPWRALLTSRVVWVLAVTHMCDGWTFFMILICLPIFLKEVLKFDIQSNGLYSSLPFLCMMLGLGLAGYLADLVIARRWLSVTATRRAHQIVSMLGIACFIVLAGYINCERRELVIMCLCICLFFEGIGQGAGYPCTPVDIAPTYSSVIFGISNTLANIPGIVAPLVVGQITVNGTTSEWRVVFYLSAGLCVFGAVLYGTCSSGELASWAQEHSREIVIDVTSDTATNSIEQCKLVPPLCDEGETDMLHVR